MIQKLFVFLYLLFGLNIQANIKKTDRIDDVLLDTIIEEEKKDEFFVMLVDDELYVDYTDNSEKIIHIEEEKNEVNYTLYEVEQDPYSIVARNFRALDEDFIVSSKIFEMFEIEEMFPRINRASYKFNAVLDNNIVKPMGMVYIYLIPKPIRRGISNFFDNFQEVSSTVNALLQWKPKKALTSASRFVINSTIGIGGIFDVATYLGIKKSSETFGETLGHYGVGGGGYLFLPLLGPTTLRDGLGTVVDGAIVNFAVKGPLFDALLYDPNILSSSAGIGFTALELLNRRASIGMGYGDFASPFEYDLIKLIFMNARELQIKK